MWFGLAAAVSVGVEAVAEVALDHIPLFGGDVLEGSLDSEVVSEGFLDIIEVDVIESGHEAERTEFPDVLDGDLFNVDTPYEHHVVFAGGGPPVVGVDHVLQ